MKRDPVIIVVGVVVALVLTIALVMSAKASESTDLQAQLDSLGAEFTALKHAREANLKKKGELDWAVDQLRPKFEQFKTDRANLNNRMDAQQALINNHDARCTGTFEDAGFVNACNSEKAQLDGTSEQLMSESAGLEETRRLLQENARVHDEEEAAVIAKDQRELARQQEIMNMARPIIARLKEIALQNDGCKAAVEAVDANPSSDYLKERMHAVCGSMFDGN